MKQTIFALALFSFLTCNVQQTPEMTQGKLKYIGDTLAQSRPDTFTVAFPGLPGDEIEPVTSPAVGCDTLNEPEGIYMMGLSVSYDLPPGVDSISVKVRAYGQEVDTSLAGLEGAIYQVIGWQSSIIHNGIQGDSLYYFCSIEDPHTPYQGNTWDRPQIQFNLWAGGQEFKRVGAYFLEGTIQPSRSMTLQQTLAVIQTHTNHDQLFMTWSGLNLAELRTVKNYYVGQCLTGSWANFVGLGVDSSFYLDFHDVLGWDKVQL